MPGARVPAGDRGRPPRPVPLLQRLHLPPRDGRGAAHQPPQSRRGPAHRPGRQLGVGPHHRHHHRVRRGRRDVRLVQCPGAVELRALPRAGPPRRPGHGGVTGRGCHRRSGHLRRHRARAGPGAVDVDPWSRRRARGPRRSTADVRDPAGRQRGAGDALRPGGPGRPEHLDAGGRERCQRGLEPRRAPAARTGPGAAPRRLGAGPRLLGRGPGPRADRGARRPARSPARRGGAAPGAEGARRPRVDLGRRAPDDRVPRGAGWRGARGHHHHLGSAPVPARHDRADGRPRRRPDGPGGLAGTHGRGAGEGARRRHGGLADEVGLPGHDEPRDPHPAQRRHRPQRPADAHYPRPRPAAPRDRGAGGQPPRCSRATPRVSRRC